MTHRQRLGLVVIGLVLSLIAVITSQQTHLTAGSAQAVPVPGPPEVGDCVLDPLPGVPQGIAVTDPSGGVVPTYPAQQIQPCTAARYGEIVSVITTPKPTVVKGSGDDRSLYDPNTDSCSKAAGLYVGMSTQPILRFWQPYLQITVDLSRPSPRQESSGQHWVACIISPAPAQPLSSPADRAYSASIQGALHTGETRNRLGACTTAIDWNAAFEYGGCRQPHSLELVASGGSGEHPVKRAEVEQTCRQLVDQITGVPKRSAANALTAQIHVAAMFGDSITSAEIPADSLLTCAVAATGNRKLISSLLAWGDHAIPWA